jgi:hypothetical protein
MNAKYLRPSADATTQSPAEFMKSSRVANGAAVIVILASLLQTAAVVGLIPSYHAGSGNCQSVLFAPAGHNSTLGECGK